MATSRKKQNDDFLFASDEKASRRKRVAAPTTPVAGPSGPAMSGGPAAKGKTAPAAPTTRRKRLNKDEMKSLYG